MRNHLRVERGKTLSVDHTRGAYPLFWAKNIRPGKQCYPASKTHRGVDFVTFEVATAGIIRSPSVILQRTTNSKQARRLVAAVISRKVVKKYCGYVSENHTIVLTPKAGRPALRLLCRLLNSAAVDRRYRRIGGSTSISVGSLKNLPLPDPRCLQTAMSRLADFEDAVELAYALSAAASSRAKAAA
jgi:adenine-specific DNA-methyltransferase